MRNLDARNIERRDAAYESGMARAPQPHRIRGSASLTINRRGVRDFGIFGIRALYRQITASAATSYYVNARSAIVACAAIFFGNVISTLGNRRNVRFFSFHLGNHPQTCRRRRVRAPT